MPVWEQPLIDAVNQLIDAGCHYRLDALAQCYAPDLEIVIVQEDGTVVTFDYEQNMAFFRQRHDAAAAPLNTSVEFNYTRQRNGIGYVMATRRMDLGAGEKKIVFTLMLRQEAKQWQVFREHAVVVGDV